jgi:cullin 3
LQVLTKTPAEPKKKVETGDVFAVNAAFKSKLRRVTVALGGSSRAATSTERAETDQKINEDRKLAIQACIVRVMKARKQATHAQLVNEVTRLLAQRFQPKPATVKKQIESLIERDYLERSTTERKMLLYIA